MWLNAILTKLTTNSSADWQHGYLLSRSVLASSEWPGCMLTWFFSHIAALVGDLAGFLVPLCLGCLPPTSPLLPTSTLCECDGYLDTWTPGMGANSWVVRIASHGSAIWSRDWLAGWLQVKALGHRWHPTFILCCSCSSIRNGKYNNVKKKILPWEGI